VKTLLLSLVLCFGLGFPSLAMNGATTKQTPDWFDNPTIPRSKLPETKTITIQSRSLHGRIVKQREEHKNFVELWLDTGGDDKIDRYEVRMWSPLKGFLSMPLIVADTVHQSGEDIFVSKIYVYQHVYKSLDKLFEPYPVDLIYIPGLLQNDWKMINILDLNVEEILERSKSYLSGVLDV